MDPLTLVFWVSLDKWGEQSFHLYQWNISEYFKPYHSLYCCELAKMSLKHTSIEEYSLYEKHKKNYNYQVTFISNTAQKMKLKIPSINVTKSAGNCGFVHIYGRNS